MPCHYIGSVDTSVYRQRTHRRKFCVKNNIKHSHQQNGTYGTDQKLSHATLHKYGHLCPDLAVRVLLVITTHVVVRQTKTYRL